MSFYNRDIWRANKEENKRRSSIQMKQNFLSYFGTSKTQHRIKKITSINDKKSEIIKDNIKEDFYLDFEKKNKAKKSLLYLLNIKSKGTFCPQIIDYFKKLKESKKKQEQLNEREENNTNENNNIIIDNINDKNNKIPIIKSKFYPHKTEINNLNHEKNEINEKKSNFNENNNIIKENKEPNVENKSIDNIIDNKELQEISNKNDEMDNHDRENANQVDNNIIEEPKTFKKDNNNINIKADIIKNKTRKKSFKKHIKKDKIETIYNEQRSELQKFGNYHLSLRTAIQSSLRKKKFIHKKK